jgi:hypothetical protein
MAARDVNSRRSFWAPSWEEGKAALGWMTEHEWADKMGDGRTNPVSSFLVSTQNRTPLLIY